MLNDRSKYGYDHVKGIFGALQILNAAYKKYHWSSIELASNLKIPYIHARRKYFYLILIMNGFY
jgi:hypothetical protein